MVKRTITITTIILILSMIVSLIIVLNKSSFAADDDIASGTSGTCSWVIDSQGVLTISPTDGNEGMLDSYVSDNPSRLWNDYKSSVLKVVVNQGVKTNEGCFKLFSELANCTEMDLLNLDTSNATNMNNMFSGCSKLTSLDLSNFNTSNVTKMMSMFSSCTKLTSLDLSNFNTSNVTNMRSVFINCSSITSINVSSFNTSNVTAISAMFSGCRKLTTLDISNFNTIKVSDMSHMFYECELLETINVSNFDTRNVTDMSGMFYHCFNVTELDVSGFNTEKVTDMNSMFDNCHEITSLDLSSFDTSKVTNMGWMFNACQKLKTLDLSNFNTSKNTNMNSMFSACIALENLNVTSFDTSKVTYMQCTFLALPLLSSLDISNFDTSNVISMLQMFDRSSTWYGPGVKSIKLGTKFSFKGNNITSTNSQAILPTPYNPSINEDVYTGKWILEDGEYGPYTAVELRNNYDGTTMAGTWIWERKSTRYTVSYSYSGDIPEGASQLPQDETYLPGDNVEVAGNATAPGYTFSGWSTGNFTMPSNDVSITGSFSANNDTPYKVEYYIEDLEGSTYSLIETNNKTGKTDRTVTATKKTYDGFTFDDSIQGTIQSGNIAGDGSLVLRLYYKRNSYNVSYSYTGTVPHDATALPASKNYKYEEEVTVAETPTAGGYVFSGWNRTSTFAMPAEDITITGHFIRSENAHQYKVEYYFDGELDDSLEETLNAEKDDEISITPQNPLKHGEKNYTLVSNNHAITVSENDNDNVIKVYYEVDSLDYEFEYPEGDGIPDKYQIKIMFKVENGSWNDGTVEIKTNIVALYDKDGNLSKEGTGEISLPEVGNKPSDGYTKGSWNKKIPSTVSSKDDGKEFIYSYKKENASIIDVIRPGGKSSNPKTGDVFYRYLVYGALGTLVLMTAIKIRRKYSRKARKIQY